MAAKAKTAPTVEKPEATTEEAAEQPKEQPKSEVAVSHAAAQAPALILDEGQVETLKGQLMNDGIAKLTDSELGLIMHQVKRTGLDPLARQLYVTSSAVKGKDEQGREKWGRKLNIQATIDGFRLIADRSGKYVGQKGPQWCGKDGVWKDVWISEEKPAAARVAILRSDFDEPLWGIATWKSYAQYTRGQQPKLMHNWEKMGDLMLAKCAEALALRKAFPQELSGIYTNDEMAQGEVIEGEVVDDKAASRAAAPAPEEANAPPKERYATPQQLGQIFGALKTKGITTKEDATKATLSLAVIDKMEDLTATSADQVIKLLGSLEDKMFADMMSAAGIMAIKPPEEANTRQAESGDTVVTELKDDEPPDLSDIPF